MCLALVKSSKSIRAQRLHQSHIHIRVVIAKKFLAVETENPTKRAKIFLQELLTNFRRQIRLGIKQQRRNVVLQRPFASTLIIHKRWLAISQHDVSRLEIAIKKEVLRSAQHKIREPAEIPLQRLLIERNRRQPQKIIFKVVQVPGDRLPVK